MKRIGIFTLFFIFLHIQPTAASSDAAFESEILLGKDGVTRGRLLMSGTRYRLETGPKGEPSVILVDIESGETTIINGDQKTYRSMPTGTRQGLVMNPIEVFRLVSGFYPRQPGGLETVNGLNCRKTTFLSQGRQLITAWNSEGIPIPVKAINHRFPEMNFELLNIRRGPIQPELLTVPPIEQDATLSYGDWSLMHLVGGGVLDALFNEDPSRACLNFVDARMATGGTGSGGSYQHGMGGFPAPDGAIDPKPFAVNYAKKPIDPDSCTIQTPPRRFSAGPIRALCFG